jgi:hypothetical protein
MVAPLSAERASADVTVNKHGEPLSMTFGSIETFNSAGADDDKTSADVAGAFSVAPATLSVAEALVKAAACAAAVAASRVHVASSDAAVRMIVMLFGFFIYFPRWILHPKPVGLDGEEIETVCELKGFALR